jgi:hypothetical protein
MNPYYYNMASDAMSNATTFINDTAQDFFTNQWPIFSQKMDLFWERFKGDPNNWIALYPLTLFFFALVVWNTRFDQAQQRHRFTEKDVEDILQYNIMGRQRRVIVVTPKKREDDHPMVRRSQATKMYIQFE